MTTLPPGQRLLADIHKLIIHCAATRDGEFVAPAEIDRWHRARGFQRVALLARAQNPELTAIGYHFVIAPNGALYTGRALTETGAHARNHNRDSIGICLAGTRRFTAQAWAALRQNVCSSVLVLARAQGVPLADLPRTPYEEPGVPEAAAALALAQRIGLEIMGHRDLPGVAKECPGFSVAGWLAGGMRPLAAHLLAAPTVAGAAA